MSSCVTWALERGGGMARAKCPVRGCRVRPGEHGETCSPPQCGARASVGAGTGPLCPQRRPPPPRAPAGEPPTPGPPVAQLFPAGFHTEAPNLNAREAINSIIGMPGALQHERERSKRRVPEDTNRAGRGVGLPDSFSRYGEPHRRRGVSVSSEPAEQREKGSESDRTPQTLT